jgi:hypothetical protein
LAPLYTYLEIPMEWSELDGYRAKTNCAGRKTFNLLVLKEDRDFVMGLESLLGSWSWLLVVPLKRVRPSSYSYIVATKAGKSNLIVRTRPVWGPY